MSMTLTGLPLIPILDLSRQTAALGEALTQAASRVILGGTYILGPEVRQFEEAMAGYLGVDHTLGVANGTDALYLALRALDIGPGDEVITTSMSYIATSEAIARCGARPVFVDIADDGTYNLNVDQLEAAVTPATKALLPVHLYGQAANMEVVMAVARQHGLAVIEDCAQAIGATWKGQRVGSFGDIGCFSFFPSKNLGAAGDAGLVSTRDTRLADKIRQLRVHGQSSQYDHASEGINSRLDELQAALLSVKLPHIDQWNAQRREVAGQYLRGLSGIDGIVLPAVQAGAEPVYHQFTLRVLNGRRDALMQALQEAGVMARIYYPIPLHLQGMHRTLGYQPGAFPVAERLAAEVLSLPMFPELREDEVARVVAAVRQALS